MSKQLVVATITVLAVLLIGFGWIALGRQNEPSYKGRKLSDWIRRLPGSEITGRGIMWGSMGDSRANTALNQSEAEKAVQHIGTNALPFLIAELHAPDGSREQFVAAWDKTKELWHHLMSRNRRTGIMSQSQNQKTSGQLRHWNAAVALHTLGPAAKPAIPDLVPMLKASGNAEDCASAAYALSGMGPEGILPLMTILTNATSSSFDWSQLCAVWALGQTPEAGRTAIPQLLALLQDKDANIRMGVVWTLEQVHTNEEVIVPALAAQLSDTGFNVRSMTEEALTAYGIRQVTKSALKEYLTNSKPYIRMAATNALLALFPKEAAAAGLK
jgi:hypothetical protein